MVLAAADAAHAILHACSVGIRTSPQLPICCWCRVGELGNVTFGLPSSACHDALCMLQVGVAFINNAAASTLQSCIGFQAVF